MTQVSGDDLYIKFIISALPDVSRSVSKGEWEQIEPVDLPKSDLS